MTAAEIAQLRKWVAEPSLENYDDDAFTAIVEGFPLDDVDGNAPSDADWTPTYDMHRAAASIWDAKAAAEADSYDFSQGIANASYKRSQRFTQALRMARRFRGLAPMRSTELVIDRDVETSMKAKYGGYPSLVVDPDPTHGGVFEGDFIEEEGDF
jgi:Asp-tRNA(Asn)/Glu-tRNA(Gln) amidotransferase A subunit family amidase